MELCHRLVLYNEHNEVRWYSMQSLNLLKIHETMREKNRRVIFKENFIGGKMS